MKADIAPPPQEVELKLALLTANPQALAARLAQLPILARRACTCQKLHNIYFDTPDGLLQAQRVALRLRRVGSEARPQWLQTLKTAGSSGSALQQRGEWEAAVPQGRLSQEALSGTAWAQIDPDGSIFNALQPVFHTVFERTAWRVRRRDRSEIEVALDIGQIESGHAPHAENGNHADRANHDATLRAPLCELELELKAGHPGALFTLALQIAADIPLLPAHLSKSERGHALAAGKLYQAQRAKVPALRGQRSVRGGAALVLQEMFSQFTGNLNALVTSDDAEVVHQARVGWRRFRSGLRLFGDAIGVAAAPSWQALEPLLAFLGDLRDLDVARLETLPPFADAYLGGQGASNASRAAAWSTMEHALGDAAKLQRKSVRYALQTPAVGACLVAWAQWIEELAEPADEGVAPTGFAGRGKVGREGREKPVSIRRWARDQVDRQLHQLARAQKKAKAGDIEQQHRVRILAKRLRYGIEALRELLPKRKTPGHLRRAIDLQSGLGAQRDVVQASLIVARLDVSEGLQEFLRGNAFGSFRV